MGRRLPGVLIFLALLASSSCTFYRERPVKTFNEATGGEGLEHAFWNDLQKRDWKDFDQHIAANFIYQSPGGRWDREAGLEHFHQFQIEEYSLGELSSEMNRDTFVVTYTITLRGTFHGQPLPQQPLRCMTVWQEHKRGWEVIAHSAPIPEGK
jgi:hypothetical protein